MNALHHAVQMHGVCRVYRLGPEPVTALDQVTLALPYGSFTAVMGPSGSGKSTLLRCAAGLEPTDAGRVVVDGTDLAALNDKALTILRRERIGFVFQSFNLLPSLTAAQNVALPLKLAGRKPTPARIGQALAAVGLDQRAGHRPAELSGGQQQRVAIARALVTGPAVLFADEPTGALDSTSGRDVLRLLRAIADDETRAVVMVTHDPVAAAHADRVLFLADGRLAGELTDPTADLVAARMTTLESRPPAAAEPSYRPGSAAAAEA